MLGTLLLGQRLQPRNHVVQVDDVKLSSQCLLPTWNTEVELQACPGCGRFFVPQPMAFLKEMLPEVGELWALCPACRRQRTGWQYLQTVGILTM